MTGSAAFQRSEHPAPPGGIARPVDRAAEKVRTSAGPTSSGIGRLIINADDWGRDRENTDRISECFQRTAVSSASGMVFMEDSERAASLAKERGLDVGLHLNLTTAFSSARCSKLLAGHQERIRRFLARNRLAQMWFNIQLAESFRYVVAVQIDEYQRLYGTEPERIDGHHHMHLCANVLLGRLLPAGTIARRNFSFQPGEKSGLNLLYRRSIDRVLARRHRLTDYFFSLAPIEPAARLQRIGSLCRHAVIELETHPINPDEYQVLWSGDFARKLCGVEVTRGFVLPQRADSSSMTNAVHEL